MPFARIEMPFTGINAASGALKQNQVQNPILASTHEDFRPQILVERCSGTTLGLGLMTFALPSCPAR